MRGGGAGGWKCRDFNNSGLQNDAVIVTETGVKNIFKTKPTFKSIFLAAGHLLTVFCIKEKTC